MTKVAIGKSDKVFRCLDSFASYLDIVGSNSCALTPKVGMH